MSTGLFIAYLILLAGIAAAGLAVVMLARRTRDHRRLLDRRIDVLAKDVHDRSLGLDERADHLGRRLERLEQLRAVDHLLVLTRVAEGAGRLGDDTARALERHVLDLHDDVMGGEDLRARLVARTGDSVMGAAR